MNLHYVLFGEGDMFLGPGRAYTGGMGSVGANNGDVGDFFRYFEGSSIIRYHLLSAFKTKLMQDRETIEKEMEDFESRQEEEK